jgi:hypothetical protein
MTAEMRTRILAGVLASLVCVAVAAWITLARGSERPTVVTSHAYYVWGDTPRDWVSWADEIAVIEVVGEEQLPHEWDTHVSREGFVGRRIQATVEEKVWTLSGAEPAPESLTLKTTDGWHYDHGELIPLKDLGSHRVEVGDRLLVAMFHSKEWGWTLMSGGVPVDATASLHADPDQTGIAEQLNGRTLPQLVRTFRSAQPFADVVRFRHLDVDDRMIAVHKYANRPRAASRDG